MKLTQQHLSVAYTMRWVRPLDLLANERISTGAPLTHRPDAVMCAVSCGCLDGWMGGSGNGIWHFKLNSPQTKWPRLPSTTHPCPLAPSPATFPLPASPSPSSSSSSSHPHPHPRRCRSGLPALVNHSSVNLFIIHKL